MPSASPRRSCARRDVRSPLLRFRADQKDQRRPAVWSAPCSLLSSSLSSSLPSRSSLQLEQMTRASPAFHISLGEFRVATCVAGKASANDTKDEPSATVKAALLTSSSL